MLWKKTEFEHQNSLFFNKEKVQDAITALKREYGHDQKTSTNIDSSQGSFNNISDIYVKTLVEKLPKHIVEKLGSFPEKLALYNLSKGLSDAEKRGLETILSCSPELCEKRLNLLDRVLTKYIGDDWNKIKSHDFLEIEVLLEAWDFTAKVGEAKRFVVELQKLKEAV